MKSQHARVQVLPMVRRWLPPLLISVPGVIVLAEAIILIAASNQAWLGWCLMPAFYFPLVGLGLRDRWAKQQRRVGSHEDG